MEKINFSELYTTEQIEEKMNETSNLVFQGKTIKVLKTIPIEKKIDFVQIALQESLENGIYNEGKLAVLSSVYLVYYYTNLEFTDEQKADPYGTFDILKSTGLLENILSRIAVEEKSSILSIIEQQKIANEKYLYSTVGVLSKFFENLPAQMEQVAEMVNNFNPEKYQAVIDFATAANGGRNINTNEEVK